MITIKAKATKQNGKIVLDKNITFEPGVKYVIESDFDLYLTWKNRSSHFDRKFASVKSIELPNFTCFEHHSSFNDNIVYFVNSDQIFDYFDIPNSVISHVEFRSRVGDTWEEPLSTSLFNSPIIDGSVSDRDPVKVFQEITDDAFERTLQPLSPNDNSPQIWSNSSFYLSVTSNSERIDPSNYRLVREKGRFMIYLSSVYENVVVKNDLYHYASENGEKRVEFTIQPGEVRSFALNDLDRSLEDYIVQPVDSHENKVNVRLLFSDYLLGQYPMLYKFVKLYIDSQNMRDTPQSFLSNLAENVDVYKMDDDTTNRRIQELYEISDQKLDDRQFILSHPDFVKAKGTLPSIKWITKSIFGDNDLVAENLEEKILRLGGSKWFERTSIYFSATSLQEVVDIASLAEKTIVGSSSKTKGVIESVNVSYVSSGQNIYEFVVFEGKPGFNEEDQFVIDKYLIKSATKNLGIIDVNVVEGGRGYKVNDALESESVTGSQFRGTVKEVDENGSIVSINIEKPGWFYRDFQLNKLWVKGENRDFSLKIFDKRVKPASQNLTTSIRNQLYDIEIDDINNSVSIFGLTFTSYLLQSYVNFAKFVEFDGELIAICTDGENIEFVNSQKVILSATVNPDTIFSAGDQTLYAINTNTSEANAYDISMSIRNQELTEVGTPHTVTYPHNGKINLLNFDKTILDFFTNESEGEVALDKVVDIISNPTETVSVSFVEQNGIYFISFENSIRRTHIQFAKQTKILPTIYIKTGKILRKEGQYRDKAGHLSSNQKLVGVKYQPFSLSLESSIMTQRVLNTIQDQVIPPGMRIDSIRREKLHTESYKFSVG